MRIDLELIRVLVAVIEEGTLTAAAERLNVTQPSISHSLKRLRLASGDQLFVKSGRRVRPTRVALEVYERFGSFPESIDEFFTQTSAFDPATSDAVFRIGLTDLGEMMFLPPLAASLRTRAPGVGIEVAPVQLHTLEDDLQNGVIDVAVTSSKAGAGVASIPMKRESYVCIGAAEIWQTDEVAREGFAVTPRVLVSADTGHVLPARAWDDTPPGSIVVRSFGAIPPLLAGGRLVSVVPSILVPGWRERWGFATWEPPVEIPDVIVYAHVRTGSLRPGQRWFLRQVLDACRSAWESNP